MQASLTTCAYPDDDHHTMSAPLIRPATLSDSIAVFALARAFATSFTVEHEAFESSFAALLESPDAFVAVVVGENDNIAGYVLGFTHHTFFANGRVAWVEEIMVAEEARRGGIGQRLMESFEAWAKERQAKLVALATRRAASFYRSLGYEESATYFRKVL
jgi:GNAT superfamily N-acetyltransferase